MFCDCRITFIRQANFPKPTRPAARWYFLGSGQRQEAVCQQFDDFVAGQLAGEHLTNYGSTAPKNTDRKTIHARFSEQALLGGRTGNLQATALAEAELRIELLFNTMYQREVKILSSQQQMIADGGPLKLDLTAPGARANQAEIRSATSYVTNQNQVAVL